MPLPLETVPSLNLGLDRFGGGGSEALRDIERSIELNGNRAPFRSRLLLDQDVATRGVNLGRIYDDLGFRQLGINQAARSLEIDPANSSAHRFLADLYLGFPRLELARTSELLQAQLLQPVGLNQVQPSLSFADLDILRSSGPTQVSFNEFSPLFQQDGWLVSGTGAIGTEATYGDELAVTRLFGRTSLSTGQFHYESDGFHVNGNQKHDIITLFGQSLLTDELSVQAEYRHRRTRRGDLAAGGDEDAFDPNLSEHVDQDIVRLGAHVDDANFGDLIASIAYVRDQRRIDDPDEPLDIDPGLIFIDDLEPGFTNTRDNSDIYQTEVQYLSPPGKARWVVGAGLNEINTSQHVDIAPCEPPCEDPSESNDISGNGRNVYALGLFDLGYGAVATLGAGYASFRRGGGDAALDEETATPRVGLDWSLDHSLRFRAAAGRTLRQATEATQTLEPTMVAGFNQLFDDKTGTVVDYQGLGIEFRPVHMMAVTAEALWRDLSPATVTETGTFQRDQDEEVYNIAVNLLPTARIAATTGIILDLFNQSRRDAADDPSEVKTLLAPLDVRYFDPAGWFVGGRASYVRQETESHPTSDQQVEEADSDLILDAFAGYRLPRRRGLVTVEAHNLLDRTLRYADELFRSNEQQPPPFSSGRLFLMRLTLSF